jgi:hypothetical protein
MGYGTNVRNNLSGVGGVDCHNTTVRPTDSALRDSLGIPQESRGGFAMDPRYKEGHPPNRRWGARISLVPLYPSPSLPLPLPNTARLTVPDL